MNGLTFSLYLCGMCERMFTDEIMIYAPHTSITRYFDNADLGYLNITTVNQMIGHIKKEPILSMAMGKHMVEELTVSRIYIQHKDYLLGLQEDKPLSMISSELNEDLLRLAFFIVGGASANYDGYLYIVHPRERIHAYKPHVHVRREGKDIRYSLDTLDPLDKLTNPHKKDNKRIRECIRAHSNMFIGWWDEYMKGYMPPALSDDGRQYYSES